MILRSILTIGALLYLFISLAVKKIPVKSQPFFNRGVSAFAILLALTAVGCSIFLATKVGGIDKYQNLAPIPPAFLIGMLSFMLVFNITDMANWQSIAANGEIGVAKHQPLRWSLIRSGLYVNWFPSLGGILLGLGLRLLYTGVNDKNIFQFAVAEVMPGGNEIIRGIVLGIILLGFLATTVSTADSYLMSAVQTLMYDLLHHTQIRRLLENENTEEERLLVKKARLYLLPMAVFMVLFFWGCYTLYNWGTDGKRSALDFQMIIYSFAISLLIPVLYALFAGYEKARHLKTTALVTILLGMLAAAIPYVYVLVFGQNTPFEANLVFLTPVYSLFVTGISFGIGWLLNQKKI